MGTGSLLFLFPLCGLLCPQTCGKRNVCRDFWTVKWNKAGSSLGWFPLPMLDTQCSQIFLCFISFFSVSSLFYLLSPHKSEHLFSNLENVCTRLSPAAYKLYLSSKDSLCLTWATGGIISNLMNVSERSRGRWLEIKSCRQKERNVTLVALTSFHHHHHTPSITIQTRILMTKYCLC